MVDQPQTLMRMAVLPCQTVPPHQQVPSVLDGRDDAVGGLRAAEGHEDLVEDHVVEHLVAGRAKALGKAARVAAGALDHLSGAAAPE